MEILLSGKVRQETNLGRYSNVDWNELYTPCLNLWIIILTITVPNWSITYGVKLEWNLIYMLQNSQCRWDSYICQYLNIITIGYSSVTFILIKTVLFAGERSSWSREGTFSLSLYIYIYINLVFISLLWLWISSWITVQH